MKFFVTGSGDWSVGVPSSFWEVSIEPEGRELDDDEIRMVKTFLQELDDNGRTSVYTSKEWNEYNGEVEFDGFE